MASPGACHGTGAMVMGPWSQTSSSGGHRKFHVGQFPDEDGWRRGSAATEPCQLPISSAASMRKLLAHRRVMTGAARSPAAETTATPWCLDGTQPCRWPCLWLNWLFPGLGKCPSSCESSSSIRPADTGYPELQHLVSRLRRNCTSTHGHFPSSQSFTRLPISLAALWLLR